MKKTLMSLILICGLCWFAGCVPTVTSDTVKTPKLAPEVIMPTPVTADLVISEQKTRGEAVGKSMEMHRLVKEAIAKALGQDPPRVDGPDVLVGADVFTELTGKELKVVVTGYPAYYKNFRPAAEQDSARLVIIGMNTPNPNTTGKR